MKVKVRVWGLMTRKQKLQVLSGQIKNSKLTGISLLPAKNV